MVAFDLPKIQRCDFILLKKYLRWKLPLLIYTLSVHHLLSRNSLVCGCHLSSITQDDKYKSWKLYTIAEGRTGETSHVLASAFSFSICWEGFVYYLATNFYLQGYTFTVNQETKIVCLKKNAFLILPNATSMYMPSCCPSQNDENNRCFPKESW